ncbi:MAG: hypothetical protein KDD55_12615 [Bdellovibrionales bacterium]|nr:hypothetical protein [Bdellovibrionales bacterium]
MAAAGVQIPEIEFLFQIVEIEKKKLERYQEDKTRPCEGVTGTKCGHCCCELLPSTMAEQLTARSLENMQSHIAKFIKRSKANP